MATLRWGAATHEGQLRTQNEDYHHAGEGLFVVADGMGGHLAGEVASEMAVARLDERLPAGRLGSRDDLVAAISEANVEIYNASLHNPDQAGMGTTITAIAVVDDPLDGRCWPSPTSAIRAVRTAARRLRQVTVDHSFVQELVAEGAITAAEARHHPRRNIVIMLGIEPTFAPTPGRCRSSAATGSCCAATDQSTRSPTTIQAILATHPTTRRSPPRRWSTPPMRQAGATTSRQSGRRARGRRPPDPTEEFDVIPVWGEVDDRTRPRRSAEIVSDPLDDEAADHEPCRWGHDRADGDATGRQRISPRSRGRASGRSSRPTEKMRRAAGVWSHAARARRQRSSCWLGAAGACSPYYVAFDEDANASSGPTCCGSIPREARSNLTREQLNAESIALVGRSSPSSTPGCRFHLAQPP
jgi:hypothetical protein